MAPPSACAASPPRRASGRGPSRACCQGGRESSLGGGQGPAADLESGAPHPTARTPMSLAPPAPSAHDHRDLLRTIAEGTAGTVGDAFLRSLARCLAAAFGADVAYVAELMDANPATRARILACWPGGELLPEDYEYALADTPCEPIDRVDLISHPTGTVRRFPSDAFIVRNGLDGYLGVPMYGAAGATIGYVCVLSRAPGGRGRGGVHRPAHLRRARRRRARAAPPRGGAARPRGGGGRLAHAPPARRRRGAPPDRPRPARRRAAAARRARPVARRRAAHRRARAGRRRAVDRTGARAGAARRAASCASWPAGCIPPA